MTEDDGQAISYKVLPRGTPVRSCDGIELGTVRRTEEARREHIFDGIVVDTPVGKRFVDAPEVARIAERGVTVTFSAEEAPEHLHELESRVSKVLRGSKAARRAKRARERARNAWDRR